MKTKKIISIMSAAVMTMTIFAGCGNKPAQAENAAEATETAESAETTPPKPDRGEMRGLSAVELTNEMTVGWNLGNTMDATGNKTLNSETSWGNPRVTQEMIDTVAQQGFNTIRIPCTWGNHIIDENYTIDPEWISRVQEICDYAVNDDMYIILNMHHEDDWLLPDAEHIDKTEEQFTAMWKQIADSFNDYGDHLILEGMNEPRIKGGTAEWNGGTAEGRECINRLNQKFIDTVRASGGNNEKRLLLITTFAAQACDGGFKGFVFPDDDNIALSLHAYTPYRFTYDSKGETWNAKYFDETVASDISNVFDKIENFRAERNIPVIITECGSVVKNLDTGGKNTDEVSKWAEAYLSTAKEHNITCVFWDNGYFYSGNELFGLLDRKKLQWYCPTIADTITGMYKDSGTSDE